MREVTEQRNTTETQIILNLNLDGKGLYRNNTGVGFLNHMLDLFARHGRFDLNIECNGDTEVDDHHTVEDIGITLGCSFANALGDMRGITRYGSFILPMDETLILCAIDLSGRNMLNFDVKLPVQKVGTFDTELVQEFLTAFARSLNASIHIKQLAGENTHHIIEGIFKALGRALKQAITIDAAYADEIPSTKGMLV